LANARGTPPSGGSIPPPGGVKKVVKKTGPIGTLFDPKNFGLNALKSITFFSRKNFCKKGHRLYIYPQGVWTGIYTFIKWTYLASRPPSRGVGIHPPLGGSFFIDLDPPLGGCFFIDFDPPSGGSFFIIFFGGSGPPSETTFFVFYLILID